MYSVCQTMAEIQTEADNNQTESGPKVIKLFPCSTQLSMKFEMLISIKISRNVSFFRLRQA